MKFLTREAAVAIHDAQLAAYGGLGGVRDEGLLESALARPQNKHAYGESDGYLLAASLAYRIARNHPFLDGNKRTAWSCAITFLRLNKIPIPVPVPEIVLQVVAMAAGEISEDDFARWLKAQKPKK